MSKKYFSFLNLAAFSNRLFVQKSLASQRCYSLCWNDRICCCDTFRNGTWITFYAVKDAFCFIWFLQQTSYLKVTFIVAQNHQSHCLRPLFSVHLSDAISPKSWALRWACKKSMERMKKRQSILQKDKCCQVTPILKALNWAPSKTVGSHNVAVPPDVLRGKGAKFPNSERPWYLQKNIFTNWQIYCVAGRICEKKQNHRKNGGTQ